MFGKPTGGARAYANVGLETSAATASPHHLIVMLFEGALVAISTAIHEIENGAQSNIAVRGSAVSKATRIINEGLRASLDKDAGGALAEQLDALYYFIGTELVIANGASDAARMSTAKRLLSEIADAWKAIAPSATGAPALAA